MKQTTIEPLPASDLFAMSVNEIPLSYRTAVSIYKLGFTTIGDLAKWTPKQWLQIRGVGKMQVSELEEELRKIGAFLGANKEAHQPSQSEV